MKRVMVALVSLLLSNVFGIGYPLIFATISQQQRKVIDSAANRAWGRGEFRGLLVGKSTEADMRLALGPPDRSALPDDQDEDEPNGNQLYYYSGVGDRLGELTVEVQIKTHLIISMEFSPANMHLKELRAQFGADYAVTHYDFDECLGDEESSPIYESPNGSITTVEYRKKGIVVMMEPRDKVQYIRYVDAPFGSPTSKCVGEKAPKDSIPRKQRNR